MPMIYEISHYLQDRVPFVWGIVEWGNSVLFQLRYSRKESRIHDILQRYPGFAEIEGVYVPELARFFNTQPH